MRKLGLLAPTNRLSQEARDEYIRLFDHPLSRTQLAAVAAIFGWTVPESCEAPAADQVLQAQDEHVEVFGIAIHYEERDIEMVQQHMECALQDFPCRYLGLPLSLRRLTRNDLQPYLDKITDVLSGWKASLMARSGRLIMVKLLQLCDVMDEVIIQEGQPDEHKWLPAASGKFSTSLDKDQRKAFNTLVILVTWEIWKHRNGVVFYAQQPRIQHLVPEIKDEAQTVAELEF
ncbi:hypothetical protein PR202_gb12898 [Eleusine coracana subsp. coracana]|uniref:Uncharacterized protein n=1 Tax=Eleusine coracana subsp. coracana TaxID=191504 RepID=A0AAV5ESQ4_ELECO|nr:hypothetical protein PR202_gb12898 [Eleusine coracana subsp. coracana]